jgi:ribosomal protein L29
MRLFAWLRPDLRLVDHVSALEKRVLELEAQQLRREVEFEDLASRIRRYLARLDTHEQRRKQREEPDHQTGPDAVTMALLRAKYPQNGG